MEALSSKRASVFYTEKLDRSGGNVIDIMNKRIALNSLLILVSTLMSLVTAELILRVLPISKKPLDYIDVYRREGLGPGGYLRENFVGHVENGFGGTVLWINNAQGFRNRQEFAIPPPKNTFRILSLGDSFTGGYRVGQDQTFSFLVERFLTEKHRSPKIEVMISVIDDPLTGLYYLTSHGIDYSPHLVLLGITLGNDLAQIYSNLGQVYDLRTDSPFVVRLNDFSTRKAWVAKLEAQTLPSYCLAPRVSTGKRSNPVWSDVYPWMGQEKWRLATLLSQVRRRFLHEAPQTVVSNWVEHVAPRLFANNGLGIFLTRPPEEVRVAYQQLFRILSALSRFSKSRDVRLLIVIFPQRFQVQDQDWHKTVEVYGLREECFDRDLPNREIAQFCGNNGINCLDPTQQMRETYERSRKSLYLPNHDMHWNARGHEALAEVLAPAIARFVTH